MASLCRPFVYSMFSHAHEAVFGDHLVLVTTARWRTLACCKITVSQPWRKYSCVAFFEAAGARFCDNATAWTALLMLQLHSASASSASIERIFSSFGLIHNKVRNRLGVEKATKLVFCYRMLRGRQELDF